MLRNETLCVFYLALSDLQLFFHYVYCPIVSSEAVGRLPNQECHHEK